MRFVSHIKKFWRFHSLIIGAVGLCAITLGCAVQEPAIYEGTWVVTKTYQLGISAQSTGEAERYLGRSLMYSPNAAKLDQAHCDSPQYQSTTLSNKEFYRRFKASPQTLGYSEDVITEVTLSCQSNNITLGSTLIFQENTVAYTIIDGTFLRLEKTL